MDEMGVFFRDVFPLLEGFDPGRFFLKILLLGVFTYLNNVKAVRYLWSTVFLIAMTVIDLAYWDSGDTDKLALLVRMYLSWMCAEVTFQSLAADEEERIHAWWSLALLFIVLL